ncbi:hypothetical protein L1987_56585 [Smallanthus sonchifolius]|uniref:Uncharacterized protein n=1 Tax=Smallanthus sonchifolius TaxID=185202 RepID=A0ACB9EE91_9ASTR|nr:hypothetical protein L1987_56585 [Smallanthus sonchifolius]
MANFKDTKIDLGVDVNIASQWKKNGNTGAGANANSMADLMNFVGSDKLAELVWLPQTGLNIKFAENKPCSICEEAPSEMRLLDTQNEEPVASLATHRVSDEVAKTSSCTGSQNQVAADTLFQQLFENGITSNVNDSGSESRSRLKTEPMMQCEHQEHIKMEKDDCCSDPFLENAQVSIFVNENDEKHEAESHGLMGSCRSANCLTKRKRKCSFEQHLILGSKRIKKQYATKTDHSFMKWISNMLKGLKSCNIYHQKISVSSETRSLESKETGFQNLFHSLFSPETITGTVDKSIGSTVLAKRFSQESLDLMEIEAPSLVKQVSLYEGVSKEAPKGIFDTIRRLRLSRTDIHKWMTSQLPVAQLEGFFLRLRVAKWEEGDQGSRYYVACITGLQRETPWKDLKQSIRVKVGDVECFVESQHVSNCDFIEDELIAWWQKTSKNQRFPVVKDLKSKLAVRRTLGM